MLKEEFDNKYVSKKVVVNCKTEELANQFLKMADKFGYKWCSVQSYIGNNRWERYKDKTCYEINISSYCGIDYYKDANYKIIEFNGFDNNQEILTYKELKENIVYQHIYDGGRFVIKDGRFNPIIRGAVNLWSSDISWFIAGKYIKVVNKKEMSISEIEKELGYEIKIVNHSKCD